MNKKTTSFFTFLLIALHLFSSVDIFNTDKIEKKQTQHKTLYKMSEIQPVSKGLFLIINNEESLQFNKYSCDDLGIEVATIKDLTSNYENLVNDKEYENKEEFRRIIKVDFKDEESCLDYLYNAEKPSFIEYIETSDDKVGEWFETYPIEQNLFLTPNSVYYNQYYLNNINAPQAWDIETGSLNTAVGLIDTGVYTSHPELSNGQISSTLSQTVNGTDNSPLDDVNGHGTFNAGIIGATTNNLNRMAGICWNITIVSLRADHPVNPTSYGERVEDVISAVNAAAGMGLKVLNYSGGSYTESLALKQAIINFNGLMIVAAGNSYSSGGNCLDNYPCYPSSWQLSNVISVGASNQNNNKWSQSNYSSNIVDLFAPGEDICSLSNAGLNEVCYKSGTSHAAPMVTAVAALLLSKYPTIMDTRTLKYSILDNVTTYSSLSSYCKTGGLLNAYAALSNPHYHDYTYNYTHINGTKHRAHCHCGASVAELHVWDGGPTWYSGMYEYGTCYCCGEAFKLL